MSPVDVLPMTSAEWLARLRLWAEAGWLRRLDAALAGFLAELDPDASPVLWVSAALLSRMEGHGHTCLPLSPLPSAPNDVLNGPTAAAEALAEVWPQLPATLPVWCEALRRSPCVRHGLQPDTGQPLVLVEEGASAWLYLRRYWLHEQSVARGVSQRCAAITEPDRARVRHWLDRLFPVALAGPDWQKLACAVALRGRLSVITGGPGTGKTYTAARLLALLLATTPQEARAGLRVALAAPTGKAAARLKQSIDTALQALQTQLGDTLALAPLIQRIGAARTLHALLGARPDTRRFTHNARQPLELDVLIVDEASMIHLEMMAALLEALPPTARLVLLGDKDQLASVEAGAVLGDLCRDAADGRYSAETARYAEDAAGLRLPDDMLAPGDFAPALAQQTVMLRQSRRFGGPIGQLAHAVNLGDAVRARAVLQAREDSVLTAWEGVPAARVCDLAVQGRPGAPGGYRPYLDALASFQPLTSSASDAERQAHHAAWVKQVLGAFEGFRLLCAVREGEWGVSGLNRAVAQALERTGWLSPRGEWYAGRPVMVTRNDPALGVSNGDIGVALPSCVPAGEASALRVWFLEGEHLRSVGVSRLAHVETAFAMTVHKSQGSEFDHTVLVLPEQGGAVLGRELVYTGITRAKRFFTLVSARAGTLEQAIDRPTRRASGLRRSLAGQSGA